jgi:hypothetical protein
MVSDLGGNPVQEDLLWWLQDERARDQFVIRYASETEVYWNDARLGKPDLVYHRPVSLMRPLSPYWLVPSVVRFAPLRDFSSPYTTSLGFSAELQLFLVCHRNFLARSWSIESGPFFCFLPPSLPFHLFTILIGVLMSGNKCFLLHSMKRKPN